MMGIAKPTKRYTPAEYYALEAKAEYKSDYYDGEIFPCGEVGPDGQLISMAGGSFRHSLICCNLGREVGNRVKGKPFLVVESNVRLRIRPTGLRTYPDVSVYCDKPEHDPEDPFGHTFTHPTLLFEVLSPGTEAYDRDTKAAHYQRIESLRALVLVKQDERRVEVHFRGSEGAWRTPSVSGIDAVLTLPETGLELPVSDIHANVDFRVEM